MQGSTLDSGLAAWDVNGRIEVWVMIIQKDFAFGSKMRKNNTEAVEYLEVTYNTNQLLQTYLYSILYISLISHPLPYKQNTVSLFHI